MTERSIPYTLLSLPRWAKIIGINPVHFQGAQAGAFWPVGSCAAVWPRHSWQTVEEFVSREDVAREILQAESDIKRVLGYAVAPMWECEEVSQWNTNGSVAPKRVSTQWGKVISGGVRAVTIIEADASVTYNDEDGDGWGEVATIAVTTDVSAAQVKVYFAGHDGDPEWEIRPTKKVASGGIVTISVDSWLMIDPALQSGYPTTSGFSAVDISLTDNFITSVDVYREYTDTSVASARFYWIGSGAENISQDGALVVENSHSGVVLAGPGDGLSVCASWSSAENPSYVKLWYHAGNIANDFLRGYSYDPLEYDLANAVAWMAAARLEKTLCDCSNVQNTVLELRRDLTQSTRGNFYMRFESMDIFSNPFGTRVGEVRAWSIVNRLRSDQIWHAGIL